MNEQKKIVVFCSASERIDECYKVLAYEVGECIGKSGNHLVTGCSTNSMMGQVVRGFYKNSNQNQFHFGHYPKDLGHVEKPAKACVLYEHDTLTERQQGLISGGDVYVILPGGFGTLYELTQVLTEMSVGHLPLRPIYIVNNQNFYEYFIDHLNLLNEQGFVSKMVMDQIHVDMVVK